MVSLLGNLIVLNFQVRKFNYVRQEILEELIKIRKSQKFDLVLIPSLKDIHQDHAVIAQEGVRAFKNTSILGYELIWNDLQFDTTCFVKLEKRHVETKVAALSRYESQNVREYMSPEFIWSLAKMRGVQVNASYAECFEVIRWIID